MTIRFLNAATTVMDPSRWNDIVVLADATDLGSGDTLIFNPPAVAGYDSDLEFLNNQNQAVFDMIPDTNPATYQAVATVKYNGTGTSTSLHVSQDGTSDAIAIPLIINWQSFVDVPGIVPIKTFALNSSQALPSSPPSGAAYVSKAKVIVRDSSGAAVAGVQVGWSMGVPTGFTYLYHADDTPFSFDDKVTGQYIGLTNSNGESEIHVASLLPVSFTLVASVLGMEEDLDVGVVFASNEYRSSNQYPAPSIEGLQVPPQGGESGIVIQPGQTEFSVRLLSSLTPGDQLFTDLNDTSSPVIIEDASTYSPVQTIKFTALDLSAPDVNYQTLRFFTQSGGTNPRASQLVKFPVYGTFENKPDDTLSRTLPSVALDRDGRVYIDLFMITPSLGFTIPANAQALYNVMVTIYTNGYEPGTSNPKSDSHTFPIALLGATSNNIAANTPQALSIDYSYVAGYDRSQQGVYKNFYIVYLANVGSSSGPVHHALYLTRLMATA